MKKIMMYLMALCLIGTSCIPSFAAAEPSAELESLIVEAKRLLQITNDYQEFEYVLEGNAEDGRTFWRLYWYDEDNSAYIFTIMDSEKTLWDYYYYDLSWSQPGLEVFNKTKSEEIARDFLKNILPDEYDKMQQVNDQIYSTGSTHFFQFEIYEKEVPVSFQYVDIHIDRYTGRVTSYSRNGGWSDVISFPAPEDSISLEEAKKLYLETLGIDMVYQSYYDWQKKELKVYSAYTLSPAGRAIDALTGEVVKIYEDAYDYYYADGETANYESGYDGGYFSDVERSEIEKMKNLISQEQAEQKVRKLVPGVSREAAFEFAWLSRNQIDKDQYVWELSWDGGHASVSANTGELISFSSYSEEEGKQNASYDTAKKEVESFIKGIAPDAFQLCKLDENSEQKEESSYYYFNYIRQVNGIDFLSNGIRVAYDKKNGKITSYNKTWYQNVDFPSIDNVLSKEVIMEEAMLNSEYGLTYVKDEDENCVLVYDFIKNRSYYYDPLTGKRIYSDGSDYLAPVTSYQDIEGKWYETIVSELLANGYFMEGDQFLGNSNITQEEFLRYLYAPVQRRYLDTEEFYDYLYYDDIIEKEEINPNSTITRQDAAKFVVRKLDLDKAANISGIYLNPFSEEISSAYQGYVSICYGLGIMKGDTKGYFNPTNNMTRAEAAACIYQTIKGL